MAKEIIVQGTEQLFFNVNEQMDFIFSGRSQSTLYFVVDGLEQCDLQFNFREDSAKADIRILFLASRDLKGSAKVLCLGKNNKVKMDIRGIAREHARVFFEAGAFIAEHAERSDLHISEQGVIFENSKIEFFPNLQINNNNVKAGHAAAVKKYRDEDLFYLMSRGLSEDEARMLLLEGFLQDFENIIDVQDVLKRA